MLFHRLISGATLVAVVLLLFWADHRFQSVEVGVLFADTSGQGVLPPGIGLLGATILFVFLANGELRRMCAEKGVNLSPLATDPAGVLLVLITYFSDWLPGEGITLALVGSLCFVSVMGAWMTHFLQKRIEGAAIACGASLFILVFVSGLSSFYLLIRQEHSAWVILGLILIVKASDIGAYAVGKTMGRHKLIPWLSPGKTWEGLFGGILASAGVAAAFAYAVQSHPFWTTNVHGLVVEYTPLYAAWVGAILAAAGVVGGMMLSMFKRDAGFKDSGGLFPGMGGALDVLDSLLVAGPLAYWLLKPAYHAAAAS